MRKTSADWFSWVLQFILGFVVGAFGTLALIFDEDRATINPPAWTPLITLGIALIGGSVTSYCGDKLWIGDSYRLIPPDEPKHNNLSRTCSVEARTAKTPRPNHSRRANRRPHP